MVRVVVRDRTDGAGDENVLPSPALTPLELTVAPNVAVVPAFEVAASELTVSAFVAKVGAVDLLPMVGACCPSWDPGKDILLRDGDMLLTLRPDGGVQKERWPLPLFGTDGLGLVLPETVYGLFLAEFVFFVFEAGTC